MRAWLFGGTVIADDLGGYSLIPCRAPGSCGLRGFGARVEGSRGFGFRLSKEGLA